MVNFLTWQKRSLLCGQKVCISASRWKTRFLCWINGAAEMRFVGWAYPRRNNWTSLTG
ncbi:hypothetical protein BDW42DRAFT_172871 [Aspergillus taichungensis]|uniref:Uncharacterized protein n=1 Tax=Aspergillus taichungensis TaxID=482145 RepID=A0A2J5HQL1_9EURO|nr:hypothetical protein BDW42DRAFT_172871 [Aspergillus taichungensis]